MEQSLAMINGLADSYLKNLDINSLAPVDMHILETSVTIAPPNEEIFNLNPIIVGNMKDVKFVTPLKNGAVHRNIVGYAWVSRMIGNPEAFKFQFSLVLNNALAALTNALGPLNNRKIKIGFTDGKVFNNCENAAGFEFRVMVLPEN